MNDLIDGWLTPSLWLLGVWSLRWALLIALAMVWFAVRPPRTTAARMLVSRLLLTTGLLLPFVPTFWGPAMPLEGVVAPPQPVVPIESPSSEQPVGVEMAAKHARKPLFPRASPQELQAIETQPVAESHAAEVVAAVQQVSTSESLGGVRRTVLVLATLWMLGVSAGTVRLAMGWFWLRRLRRSARIVADAICQNELHRCREQLRVRRAVKLGTHEAVDAPILIGGLRPWILVPARWQELAPPARRAILLHELAHVRRHDDFAKFCEELVRVVFFFHPLVHWLLARIDAEREELCDVAVVNQGVAPRELAGVLVECCRDCGAGRPALLLSTAALPFFRRRTVMDRIQFLMEEKSMSRWKQQPSRLCALGLIVLAVGVAAAVGGFGASAADPERPDEAAASTSAESKLPTVKDIQAGYRENFARIMPLAAAYHVRSVETMACVEENRWQLRNHLAMMQILQADPKDIKVDNKPIGEEQIVWLGRSWSEDNERFKRELDPDYIKLRLTEHTAGHCWFWTDGKSFHGRWPRDAEQQASLFPGPVIPSENLNSLYEKITLASWSADNKPPLRCWFGGGGGRVSQKLSDCRSISPFAPMGFVKFDWTQDLDWHDLDRFMSEDPAKYQVVGPAELNGKPVIVVDGLFTPPGKNGSRECIRAWIDPSQGYLPLRLEWRAADSAGKLSDWLSRSVEVLDVRHVDSAHYPMRIKSQKYVFDYAGNEKHQQDKAAGRVPADAPAPPSLPGRSETWEVTELLPRHSIEPAALALEFPKGADYSNALDGRMYHAGDPTPLPEDPKPLQPGEVAPEWQIKSWTDGKSHSLSDHRRKVVVLDFFGLPAKGSEQMVPFMKSIRAKFAGREIVFVSVLPAGTDMQRLREFQDANTPHTLAGIDDGRDASSGATLQKYLCEGIFVIGRDGKVAFNTSTLDEDACKKIYYRASRALSLPWPLNENSPPDQETKLFEFLISEQIEAALGKE